VDESGVLPADIIPPWLSMLKYHLVDEQEARWWLQSRDVVSAHRYDHHHYHHWYRYQANNVNLVDRNTSTGRTKKALLELLTL
jgi:hypothetical protein